MRRATSKDTKKIPPVRNVDAYIETAPKTARVKLVQLRRIIKAAAPQANESIGYRMPYYNYNGALVWFAAFKNHIGFFIRPLSYRNTSMSSRVTKPPREPFVFQSANRSPSRS